MAELVVPFTQLTTQQRGIVEEATNNAESLFIEGAPGSGKTLVSLHIVKSLIGKEVVRPLVLIYNHSLHGYLRSSFEQLGIKDSITINTKDKFFWSLRKQYSISVPDYSSYEEKYSYLLTELLKRNIDLSYTIVILDEIQDFSEMEWQLLKKFSSRFIFLGDFEQKIYDGDLKKSTITQVARSRSLDKIFRFGEMIAKLVQKFSRSGRKLDKEVVRKDTIKPVVLSCATLYNENAEIVEIIKARRNDGGRIGVISLSKQRLADVHRHLEAQGVEHFHAPDTKQFADYNFSSNSPVLITSASAKGLEFSTVILTGYDEDSSAASALRQRDGLKEHIYVSLSRATNHLFVLRNPNTISELQKLEVSEAITEGEGEKWF